jgi:hypothetical protein
MQVVVARIGLDMHLIEVHFFVKGAFCLHLQAQFFHLLLCRNTSFMAVFGRVVVAMAW